MRSFISLFTIIILAKIFTGCTTENKPQTSNSEIPLYGSDLIETIQENESDHTTRPVHGPFYKQINYLKIDDNGGFEEYRLNMNLYETNIPDGKGSLCHGTLTLYVKTPDNTEGIEISKRIIEQVEQIEENTASLFMASNEERPTRFSATIAYDSITHTYSLDMKAPSALDDLMINQLILQ